LFSTVCKNRKVNTLRFFWNICFSSILKRGRNIPLSEEKSLLAAKVRRWRKYMGLTVDKASVVCCVTQVKYQKFEEGIATPIPAKINRMSIFASIEPSAFEDDISFQEFEALIREQIEKDNYKYQGWLKVSPAILSEKLKSIREIHSLTQRQMALISNCTIYEYACLESGKSRSLPIGDTSVVSCISIFFDIPLSDLLNNELDQFSFSNKYLERLEYQQRKNQQKGD